ncbi:MAG TPA: XRE family transcriptional regulator [Mucilaginibacter sp.]|jgi:transcriptional regulator with XRE-family HTH domain|nr:XRE family transcriptional regulator [Mucilaginibacter sp.]
MEEDVLIQISNRIKERRREKNITVQELASRVNVSKGLISQVENSRTVPSLIVLIDIIKALEIDLNEFFKDIRSRTQHSPVLVKRKDEYERFEKELAVGFNYQRIFTRFISHSTIDIVILELEPHAERPLVETEAFEYKFVINGDVDYLFTDHSVSLHEGDSILFDGRIPHTPKNMGQTKASMLVIYFFEEKTSSDIPNLA